MSAAESLALLRHVAEASIAATSAQGRALVLETLGSSRFSAPGREAASSNGAPPCEMPHTAAPAALAAAPPVQQERLGQVCWRDLCQ